jgi:formylglycine-generating enzyme required for sulfatase activity
MKPAVLSVLPALAALATAFPLPSLQAQGAEPSALSLALNGTLTFQVVPGYTNYTVEWAPTVQGPWRRSWDGLTDLNVNGPAHTVEIPMFFRVLARGTAITVPAGMGYVVAGEFLMGDNHGLAVEAWPVRVVGLRAFFIDRFEVTKALWDEVRAWAVRHGYDLTADGYATAPTHPVAGVNWHDAIKWCNARSEMAGLAPAYFTDPSHATPYRVGVLDLDAAQVDWAAAGYRLPTEAEWEKAARGGLEGHHFPWPSAGPQHATLITGIQANYWNSGDLFDNATTPVGYYDGHQAVAGQDMANGYGLHDMAGNVAEMCWDRWATYDPLALTDPHGPDTGTSRVLRGGSWYDSPVGLRCAHRRSFAPSSAAANRGFRCVRRVP